MEFLDDHILERSAVVANCRMNRDRTLSGSNSYANELGFNPLGLVLEKAKSSAAGAKWLDLCCGSGRALIGAAQIVQDERAEGKCEILGVDLVGMFSPMGARLSCLKLVQASLADWQPDRCFDVVTCVHGLHYIGDKLGLIARVASWLTNDGVFAANLDLNNIKCPDGRSAIRSVSSELRRNGLDYHRRTRLIICKGRRLVAFPFRYLGANDEAGPNYTRQPVVDSYYSRID